eukprot:TRINITY_DN14596_c0_g1_i1.p1 TRINITY_DN14596_c0_g1~~TRINITY_DN14596_c0_g1_i1.p1  ORF type:complete len:221 (-),score=45.96 TRINITY_DN14596_c0_g1_i1:45-674(-)
MTCDSCVQSVKQALAPFGDTIESLEIKLDTRQVVVSGSVSTSDIVRAIRAAGLRVAVAGKSSSGSHLGSAVAQFVGPQVKGVIFFTQVTDEDCLIDVTLDGLQENEEYLLALHQWGDMSENFKRVGNVLSDEKGEYGRIGTLSLTNTTGKLNKTVSANVDFLYGRSACLHNKDSIVAAAMVVRSAGVFQNTKRICACDGTSIWEAQSTI